MADHKTSAWPLALAYAVLIAYASLYPFEGWRLQGLAPWAFLASPWSRWWTAFDFTANALGYAPLGFLIALAYLRSGVARRAPAAVGLALAAGLGLSLLMEGLQTFLPARVPSNLDLALNAFGALAGGVLAAMLERLGGLDRWSRFRERWFVGEARGALVLLALWPPALLFPPPVPFGLGQVLERVERGLAEWLDDTPFLDWLPVREVELQPLVPMAESLCVMLGLLVPCLLGYSVMTSLRGRLALAALALGAGIGASALSSALSFGPAHAWAWVDAPSQLGLLTAGMLAAGLSPVPRRGCAALLLLALVVHLSLLNQAPANAYFSLTLQAWEQGRFIRFHGLVQWLGWLWPYAALAYVILRLSRSEPPSRIRS